MGIFFDGGGGAPCTEKNSNANAKANANANAKLKLNFVDGGDGARWDDRSPDSNYPLGF